MKYEFSIQQDTLNSGEIVLTPVFRVKARWRILTQRWQRIALVEGRYQLLELDFNPALDRAQCRERIEGYKAYLKESVQHQTRTQDFLDLEVVEEGETRQRFFPISIF